MEINKLQLQKIYDASVAAYKNETLHGIEPHLQTIAQVLIATARIVDGCPDFKLPQRLHYESVDSE